MSKFILDLNKKTLKEFEEEVNYKEEDIKRCLNELKEEFCECNDEKERGFTDKCHFCFKLGRIFGRRLVK